MKEFLKKEVNISQWILEQAPLYTDLPLKPIPNGRERYYASISLEALDALDKIPGINPSRKINLLYWNYIARQEKRKARYEILNKLFPKD